jgi:hypothetical protein
VFVFPEQLDPSIDHPVLVQSRFILGFHDFGTKTLT